MKPFIFNATYISGKLPDIISKDLVPISVRRQICVVSDISLGEQFSYYEFVSDDCKKFFYKTDCASFVVGLAEQSHESGGGNSCGSTVLSANEVMGANVEMYVESCDDYHFIVIGVVLPASSDAGFHAGKEIFAGTLYNCKKMNVFALRVDDKCQ